ncbi:MAG: Gfo/Idh/MocA family oxidoreductase [Candidatus Margulisiibacteriota bacterium]
MAVQAPGRVLRAALIGCSGIGVKHAEAYRFCKNIQLAAVVDLQRESADRLAGLHNVKAYYDVEDVLGNPTIDVIDIAAPTKFHMLIATDAARAGQHCICEKPIATNYLEYQMMADAFRQSGTTLGGIFQHRFSDEAMELARKIKVSELGYNLKASSTTKWFRDDAYWLAPGRAMAGGGVLTVHAIHAIDLVMNLLGEPVSVTASVDNTGQPEGVEVEHTGTAKIIFKSGATADVYATTRAWSPKYPSPGQPLNFMDIDERHQIAVTGSNSNVMFETPPQPLVELFARNLDSFAGSILAEEPPAVSLDSAWQTIWLIKKMYESAKNGGASVAI